MKDVVAGENMPVRGVPDVSAPSLRVLIIEDSEDDANLMVLALSQSDLLIASERVETLEELHAALARGPWDIVLSDYTLPALEAPRSLSIARKIDPDVPFVVLSGSIGEEVASDLLRAGANDYILKRNLARLVPVVKRELQAAIDRRARRAAENAAFRLAAIVQSSSDAIIAENLEGVITSWNPAAERLYGWPAAEAIGRAASLVVPEERSEELASLTRSLIAGQPGARLDTERVRRDGTRFPVSLTLSPILDDQGTMVGISKIVRDLSSERQTANLLAEHALILANVRDSVIVTDLEGTVTYWNEGATRLFGWSAEEMRGRSLMERFPEQDRAQIGDEVRLHIAGSDWVGEVEDYRRDGSRVWIDARVTRICDAAGRAVGVLGLAHDISERKRAHEALHQSELEYRALADSLPQLVWRTDPEGELKYLNQSWVEYTGLSFEELYGRHWSETVHPEDRPRTLEAWSTSVHTGADFAIEYRLRRKDGNFRWQLVRAVAVRDEAGAILRWVGTCLDIEDQKQERLAQEQLAAVVEASEDMIIRTTTDGIIQTWNGGAERALGYSSAEMIGRPLSIIADQESREIPDWVLEQILAGESVRGITTTRVRKDGSRAKFSLTASPIRDGEGRIIGVSGISRDVTEQLKVYAERETLLARFRLYLERMPITCITTTPEGRIEEWNFAAERIFGYSAEEVAGKTPAELGIVQDAASLICTAVQKRVVAGELGAQCTIENRTKDGRTIFCEWFVTPLQGPSGTLTGLLLMAVDNTENRHLEAQLRQSQKMEGIGQLAGGIAHDFNNMLAVINGYSELMLESLPGGHALRGYVEEILKAGGRAGQLTRQLLAFSRRQILDPKVLDLRQVVLGLDAMLRRLIGEDIELVTLGPPDPLWAKADPGQFEQVIVNLAVNARDAMPTGGTLTISTERFELDAGATHLHRDLPLGTYVLLSIQDTGTGIPPEVLPRIFEPFFTTKEIGKGTGLGLPTVYGIVQQSGGQLLVESTMGQGTAFRIYLPLAAAPLVAGPELLPLALPSGTETILVVEDEPMVRALMVNVLQQSGYTILEALQADEALRMVDEHAGPIHLLLTDVVMPHTSGPTLAQAVLVKRPETAVLFVSGYTDDAVIRHGVLTKEVELLQKPFGMRELAERVRQILDKHRPKGVAEVHAALGDLVDRCERKA